jgi:hypothetical protein
VIELAGLAAFLARDLAAHYKRAVDALPKKPRKVAKAERMAEPRDLGGDAA